jgi:hypothetical protein
MYNQVAAVALLACAAAWLFMPFAPASADIIWFAPIYSTRGYGSEAAAFLHALEPKLSIRAHHFGSDPMRSYRAAFNDSVRAMLDRRMSQPADPKKSIVICHAVPPIWGETQKMIKMDQVICR